MQVGLPVILTSSPKSNEVLVYNSLDGSKMEDDQLITFKYDEVKGTTIAELKDKPKGNCSFHVCFKWVGETTKINCPQKEEVTLT